MFDKIQNPIIDVITLHDEEFFNTGLNPIYKSPQNLITYLNFRNLNKDVLGYYITNYTYLTYSIEDEVKSIIKYSINLKNNSEQFISTLLRDSNITVKEKLFILLQIINDIIGYESPRFYYSLEYIDNFQFFLTNEPVLNKTYDSFFGFYSSAQQNVYLNLRRIDEIFSVSEDYNPEGNINLKQYAFHTIDLKSSEITDVQNGKFLFIIEKETLTDAEKTDIINIINSNFNPNPPINIYEALGFLIYFCGKDYLILLIPSPQNFKKFQKIKNILQVAKQNLPSTYFDYYPLSYATNIDFNVLANKFTSFNISQNSSGQYVYKYFKNVVKNYIYEKEFSAQDSDLNRNQFFGNTNILLNQKRNVIFVENTLSNEEEYYPIGYDTTAQNNFGNFANVLYYECIGFDKLTSNPIQYYVTKKYEISGIFYRDYKIQTGGVVPINNDELTYKKDYNYTVDQALTVINPPNNLAFDLLEVHKYVYNLTYDYSNYIVKNGDFGLDKEFYTAFGDKYLIRNFDYGYVLNEKSLYKTFFKFNKKYYSEYNNLTYVDYFILFPKDVIVSLFNKSTDTDSLSYIQNVFKEKSQNGNYYEIESLLNIFGGYKILVDEKTIKYLYLEEDATSFSNSVLGQFHYELFNINIFKSIYHDIYAADIIKLFDSINRNYAANSLQFDSINNIINQVSLSNFLNTLFYKKVDDYLKTQYDAKIKLKYATSFYYKGKEIKLNIDDYVIDKFDNTSTYIDQDTTYSIDGTTHYLAILNYPTDGVITLKDVFYIKPQLIQLLYTNRHEDSFSTLTNAHILNVLYPGYYITIVRKESNNSFTLTTLNLGFSLDSTIADNRITDSAIVVNHNRVFSLDTIGSEVNTVYVLNKDTTTIKTDILNLIKSTGRLIYTINSTYVGRIIYSPLGYFAKNLLISLAKNRPILISV